MSAVETVHDLTTSKASFIEEARGRGDLFIRQPYDFKAVDALQTNFDLPRSTLSA